MLLSLSIQNYILIDQLELKPDSGLSTITGETGAGKSIMLGAIGLLMGKRADSRTLLNEQEKCIIEGAFKLSKDQFYYIFEKYDLDFQEDTLIRREISPLGKSRSFINDTPVLLDPLRELGNLLLDIHSQHDTLLLKKSLFQLRILDTMANNAALLEKYRLDYQAYKKADKGYRDLELQSNDLQKEYDYNLFLLEELEKANLESIEKKELEEEQQLLDHTEEIKQQLQQAAELIDGNEMSLSALMGELKSSLSKISDYSEVLKKLSERSQGLFIELMDLLTEVEREESDTEYSPERAEFVNNTLSELYRLEKKHQASGIEELVDIQTELQKKVLSVKNLDVELEKHRKARDEAWSTLMKSGNQLREQRINAIPEFIEKATALLSRLSMPEAVLKVEHNKQDPDPNGIDQIQFLFSANRGIAAEELSRVASGGEFSRLMFVFKYMMAGKTFLPTFIFDEIDTGVSGEIALQLGQMMKEMAESHQVLVITHLPQVASLGKKHFFVYKKSGEEKTLSHIRELEPEERIREIAKMISGDHPSESAMQSARELVGSKT